MKIKSKMLICFAAFSVSLLSTYLIIDHIPASYVQINTDENISQTDHTTSDICGNVNIMFAVDSGFISSDCNTGNTIIDSACKIFKNEFSDKYNVSVEICTFSGYTSSFSAEVVSSQPLKSTEEAESYISQIKKDFGKSKGRSASMLIPAELAEISNQKNEYCSTYIFVLTDGKNEDYNTQLSSDDSVCSNVHISFILPSDSSDRTLKNFRELSDLSGGQVFSEYIRTDGINNISDKLPDDLCTYITESLKKYEQEQSDKLYNSVTSINDVIQLENGSQLYAFANGKKVILKCQDVVDSDKDGCPDSEDPFPDEYNNFYSRRKAREHAKTAYGALENGQFRYLSPQNGDSATNCANYVSQCINAGGYPMTDNWYMKQYDSRTPKIKKFTDKLTSWTGARLFESFNIGKSTHQYYTDMSYIWTNSWSCANVQAEYGEQTFFDDSLTVTDFSDVSEAVLVHDVQSGDVIYQGIDDKHHVLMITDISDDGTLFVSSHNPPKYQEKVDESFWKKGGFSEVVIYKVKDIIK